MFHPAQLRAFLAVVERGSVRAAADSLDISPAAVSSSLKTLQDAVGVALFSREGRGIKLTGAGLSFAGDVQRIVALSIGSIYSARTAAVLPPSPLRIGAVAAAGEAFLGELLARFMRQAPDWSIELEVVKREALWRLVEERKIDFGVAEVPPKRSTLHIVATRRNDYIVAGAPRKRYDKAALARSLWLVRETGSGTRVATDEFFRDYGIAPPTRVIGSAAAIVHCVRQGAGLSLLPRDMVATALAERTAQEIKTALTPKSRPWCLIAAADRERSAAMQAFVRMALRSRAFVALG
jgi:LysR family transcriptional regulator, low CO2-responsive transcriptional regulator